MIAQGIHMIKKVLIVDDDHEMLLSLQEGLGKYDDTFSVLTAEDGLKAVEVLKKNPISLVVTDLKMPGMDGFGLLGHVMENYPDIPVIIVTGYSTSEMKRLARQGGAVGYIAKPFLIENLAGKIITTLRKESEGGTLHGVSSGIFLQLIEMEERTCTIRLTEQASGRQGVLFFKEGDLFDARLGNLQGVDAAYKIFSWDGVTLSIQNGCPRNENMIEEDLQAILLEAMRRKDEADDEVEKDDKPEEIQPIEEISEVEMIQEENGVSSVRAKLESELGNRSGILDVYPDDAWSGLLATLEEVGAAFNGGKLVLGYIDRQQPEGSNDFVLVPAKPPVVVMVSPKSPRDRIIEVLSWR
jgi:CheY-like chemotaxis protein